MNKSGTADATRALNERQHLTLWAHYANIILGAWLISSPFALGYLNAGMIGPEVLRVTTEHGLPPPEVRALAMVWSDVISGFLLCLLGALSVSPARPWARWAVASVGLWLLFAPLVFWAPSAAAYANDTLVGSLAIAFALIIPGLPGQRLIPGPETPPGWSLNPSTWLQRAPIIALALLGFFISRYLTAYQLGHIKTVWDPFFGQGTAKIITSDISRAFPIPDAGLGAVTYILEALTGFIGGIARWRTLPWMVMFFGFLVVPLGVTSVLFIILQPLVIGTWCTLCLITAAAMLIMVSPALDEIIATGQYLLQSRRAGKSVWRIFWFGGSVEGASQADAKQLTGAWHREALQAVGLTTIPWNLLVTALIGAWLMFAPSILNVQGSLADSDHLVGSLVVTFSVIAIGETARSVRLTNIAFGAWLIAVPWLLDGATTAAMWSEIISGAALILLSIPRGEVSDRYGSWNRYVI